MNILYVSNLTGDLWAGPNNSVPAQIKAQAKLDNVFWYNVNKNIIKEWGALYHNLLEYPSEKLADLPHPFNKPDIAVIEQLYCYPFSKIVSDLQKNKIPYVVIPRSSLTERAQKHKHLKKILGNLVYFKRILKQAAGIQYLTSQEYLESGDKWNKNNFIIPNGISIKKEEIYSEGDNIIISYIGRIDIYQKRLDLLMDAISINQQIFRDKKCLFRIFGPNRDNSVEKLTRIIQQKGIGDLVELHGAIFGNEKEDALRKSNLFIMTSAFEGHSMGLIESLSYGLPCIITPGTNMANEVREYNAGWTADEDALSVSEKIKLAIQERESWDEKRKNARKLAEQYSWDSLAQKSHEEFKRIIKSVV